LNTHLSSTTPTTLHSRGLRSLFERGINAVALRRTSFGFKRHLHTSWPPPAGKIPIAVRELMDSDIPLILPHHIAASNRREGQQINARRKLLTQNILKPFVAIDQSCSRPCFIQWSFDSSHNDFITRFFKGRFPRLQEGERLLENAYTHPDYRGQGVMAVAMSKIADLLATHGAIEVITFVETTNVPSLKGCTRAGFTPFVTRTDLSVCGGLKRYRVFEPIAPHTTLDFSTHPVSLLETTNS
jgi:hypothetical protein